jgi:hypothetical protein
MLVLSFRDYVCFTPHRQSPICLSVTVNPCNRQLFAGQSRSISGQYPGGRGNAGGGGNASSGDNPGN